jgi:hypothetical protein
MNSQPRQLLCLLFFLLAGGCGTPLPPAANPGQAQSALKTALDAWQKGETAESLQSRSPAINVNDPGWSGGDRLMKYEIQSEQASGQSWKVRVLLTVQSGSGSPAQQQVTYTVDTTPAVVVVRDFE